MKSSKKKKVISQALEKELSELEEQAAEKEIQIHYDMLEAAGLKLKGGLCKINGAYHIFIDRRKPISEKIDILKDCFSKPLPEEAPDSPDE